MQNYYKFLKLNLLLDQYLKIFSWIFLIRNLLLL